MSNNTSNKIKKNGQFAGPIAVPCRIIKCQPFEFPQLTVDVVPSFSPTKAGDRLPRDHRLLFLFPIILSGYEGIGILANLGKGGEIVNLAFPWVDKS